MSVTVVVFFTVGHLSGEMAMKDRWQSGWTLVELVVVMAVSGLLLALVMPALLATRETARRNACHVQLRQLGLALQQFEQVRQVLPPGALLGAETTAAHQYFGRRGGSNHAWTPFLLPYLDCVTWSHQYDWTTDWRSNSNQLVRESRWKQLICPATPQPDRWDYGQFEPPANSGGMTKVERWRAAVGDYAPAYGVDSECAKWDLIDASTARLPRGVLVVNEVNPLARITDGLSQTLCLVEDAGRPQRYGHRGQLSATWNSNGQLVSGKVTGAAWSDARSPFILHGSMRSPTDLVADCAVNCSNDNEIYGFHRGGANGLLADGAVRFLADTLDLRCAARLVTREASETTP